MNNIKKICCLCLKQKKNLKTFKKKCLYKMKTLFPELINSILEEHGFACGECCSKLDMVHKIHGEFCRNSELFVQYISKVDSSADPEIILKNAEQNKFLTSKANNHENTQNLITATIENDQENNYGTVATVTEIKKETEPVADVNDEMRTDTNISDNINSSKTENVCDYNIKSEVDLKTDNLSDTDTISHSIFTEEIYIKPELTEYDREFEEEVPANDTASNSIVRNDEQITQKKTKIIKQNPKNSEIIQRKYITGRKDPIIFNNCENLSVEIEKIFVCDVCNKSFAANSNLVRHKRTHTGEKPFQCELCDKSFNQRSTLLTHHRVHTGEKPYKCEHCDKTFSDNSSLYRHARAHGDLTISNNLQIIQNTRKITKQNPEPSTNQNNDIVQYIPQFDNLNVQIEKIFVCNICDKSFAANSNLVRHKRTHTGEKPFQCELCDKSFSQRSSLMTHHRIHTGEKPYKCEHCDKTFSDNSSLYRHTRVHDGDRHFACDRCNKTFTANTSLSRHKRMHCNLNN